MPGHWMWTFLEGICAAIFLVEMIIRAKIVGGWKNYFTHKQDKTWHILDAVIMLAV